MNLRPLSLLLVFLLSADQAFAKRARPVDGSARVIPAAVAAAVDPILASGVPGVSVAIRHHGKLIYAVGRGRQSVEALSAGVGAGTVFQAGSVTKQFAAAAIMRLVEEGQLRLDDRASSYLPELNDRGTNMTVRHLLTHTSGLPEYTSQLTDPFAELTTGQYFNMVNQGALHFTPGALFRYNNAGYYALALIVERLSGRSWDEFVALELTAPAGLSSTGVCNGFAAPQAPAGNAILNGQWVATPPIHMSNARGAGDVCSTATDLTLWSRALASGAIVSADSYRLMTTPLRLNSGVEVDYGFGLTTHEKLGRRAVTHNGFILGYQAQLAYYPDDDLAIAVLINAGPSPTGISVYDTEEKIAAAVLGVAHQ